MAAGGRVTQHEERRHADSKNKTGNGRNSTATMEESELL